MAELSFFVFTKTTLLYYGPDLLAQLTAFLLWLSPLLKEKKSKVHMYYTKHLFSSAGQLHTLSYGWTLGMESRELYSW